jgi:hypothetical protein
VKLPNLKSTDDTAVHVNGDGNICLCAAGENFLKHIRSAFALRKKKKKIQIQAC